MPLFRMLDPIRSQILSYIGPALAGLFLFLWLFMPRPDIDFEMGDADETCTLPYWTKDEFIEQSMIYEKEMDIEYEKKKQDRNRKAG